MATPTKSNPVLAAAGRWRQRSLIGDQSVFAEDELWTMENHRELWVAIGSASQEATGFLAALKEALNDRVGDVARLCAELLWVIYLCPNPANTRTPRKVELIKEIYGLSGSLLADANPQLQALLATGIANPGVAFNTERWTELKYLIRAVVSIKKLSRPDRESLLSDPLRTGHVLDEVVDEEQPPQMSHMLRHLLFPDHFEPIFNRRDKRRIIESLGGIRRRETKVWPVTKLDKELGFVRQQLEPLDQGADLSFYAAPLVTTWRHGPFEGIASSERRYWVESCDVQQRQHRQGAELAVGAALCGARRAPDGDGSFELMREMEPGDVVLHFTDGGGFSGVSVVEAEVDESFVCPQDSQWAGLPGYRVSLRDHVEVTIAGADLFADPRYSTGLRRLAEQHPTLFFNRQLTLNRATYLCEAPEPLVCITDDAFFRKAREHLPHLQLPAAEDLPATSMPSAEARREHPLNQVLYGPPGTGKTYNAMLRAVEICDGCTPESHDALMQRYNELQATDRIKLVTFHPSYSYADFVEDELPVSLAEEDGEEPVATSKPGAFKSLADLARAALADQEGSSTAGQRQTIWKLSLGDADAADHETTCNDTLEGNFVTIPMGDEQDFGSCATRDKIREQLRQLGSDATVNEGSVSALFQLVNQMQIGDVIILADGIANYRAIGRITGNYRPVHRFESRKYQQVRAVEWIATYDIGQPWNQVSRKKFSRAPLNQLDPTMLKMDELTERLRDASHQPVENYVLIIDEMARGNVTEIFGELITLIEPDKRAGATNAMSATLPTSGERFDVPPNLYIIGTLNAANPSAALADSALRRRFRFERMSPDSSLIRGADQLGTISDSDGGRVDLRSLMDTINRRIEFLAGADKTLGHAFFMSIGNFDDLVTTMHQQIIPELVQICDGDWAKVQLVFKDILEDGKANAPQIVAHEVQSGSTVFGTDSCALSDTTRYQLTPPQEMTADAFRKVYR